MHKEIFSPEQIELLPLVRQFIKEYYLVGGTAIALYIGHRRSIDFDLFTYKRINVKSIVSRFTAFKIPYSVTRRVSEQINIEMKGVKFTFFQYPYKIVANRHFEETIRMPELLDLSAMKAYALGRRSKWKDYVDLYFLLKDHFTIEQISKRALEIYDQMFSEKLFRAQLAYFDDINYSEPLEYLIPAVSENEIKEFLIGIATDIDFF